MISELTLNMAVEQAVISSAQADSLKLIESSLVKNRDFQTPDHEKIRFISGFGDIFVFIGIMFFLGASGYFLFDSKPVYTMWLVLTALSWSFSELILRRKNNSFLSTTLLIYFAFFTFLSSSTILSNYSFIKNGYTSGIQFSKEEIEYGVKSVVDRSKKPVFDKLEMQPDLHQASEEIIDNPFNIFNRDITNLQTSIAAFVTFLLLCLHYLRFRVPITIAASSCALGIAVLFSIPHEFIRPLGRWLAFVFGLMFFTLAMLFDLNDLARKTRKADIAFWLYCLAVLSIFHFVLLGLFDWSDYIDLSKALFIHSIFIILAMISLLIDRPVIIVSGLVYVGILFAKLFDYNSSNAIIPSSVLTLGIFTLFLSFGWHPLRALALRALPASIRLKLSPSTSLGTS